MLSAKRLLLYLFVLCAPIACIQRAVETSVAQGAKPAFINSKAAAQAGGVSAGLIYTGMCDGSAGAALDAKMFVVATDESNGGGLNFLNIYLFEEGGAPVSSLDLTPTLVPEPKNKEQHDPDANNAEADIEGAAKIGNRIYWIASHSHSRKGKRRVDRYRFFATDVENLNGNPFLRLAGSSKPFPAYMNLVKDMGSDAKLAGFDLKKLDESNLAPEDGGLNIEGLSATRDNKLLIAFRSPVKDGKALLVPLENPNELIEGTQSQAKFGEPLQLNLGGLGIRDIAYWGAKDTYIIIAGAVGAESTFKLFQWSGKANDEPQLIRDKDGREINLSGLNPEGIVINPASNTLLLLSDDGDLRLKSPSTGKSGENKDLPAAERLFRTLRVSLLP